MSDPTREALDKIGRAEEVAIAAIQAVVFGEDRVAVLRALHPLSEAINEAERAALSTTPATDCPTNPSGHITYDGICHCGWCEGAPHE